jgi:hypothetical protein
MEKEIQELRSNIKEQEVSSLDSFTEKKRTII